MDQTVGSFDDPARFRPASNFPIETALEAWMDVTHPPGKRLDERAPAVDRWMNALGKQPD